MEWISKSWVCTIAPGYAGSANYHQRNANKYQLKNYSHVFVAQVNQYLIGFICIETQLSCFRLSRILITCPQEQIHYAPLNNAVQPAKTDQVHSWRTLLLSIHIVWRFDAGWDIYIISFFSSNINVYWVFYSDSFQDIYCIKIISVFLALECNGE